MDPLHDPSSGLKNGEGIKVLVIDDEPFLAETLAEALEKVGYECVIATSGKAGARKLDEDIFDIVLTDLKMEDMDGWPCSARSSKSKRTWV